MDKQTERMLKLAKEIVEDPEHAHNSKVRVLAALVLTTDDPEFFAHRDHRRFRSAIVPSSLFHRAETLLANTAY